MKDNKRLRRTKTADENTSLSEQLNIRVPSRREVSFFFNANDGKKYPFFSYNPQSITLALDA